MLFRNFVNNSFFGSFSFLINFSQSFYDYRPQYSLFADYYCFTNFVNSPKWPVFNTALEAFLEDRKKNNTLKPRFMSFSDNNTLTAEEKVNLLLQNENLSTILKEENEIDKIPTIIKIKGAYLFKMFQKAFNKEDFIDRINRFIKKNRFHTSSLTNLFDTLDIRNDEAESVIERWYQDRKLPGYKVSQIEMFKILDEDRMRYQVLFIIENPEKTDGLIEVNFQYHGFFRRMMNGQMSEEEPPRIYKIGGGKREQIGIVLESEPQAIIINTLISKNLPQKITTYFDKAEERKQFTAFDGVKTLKTGYSTRENNVIFLDNADSAFHIQNSSYQSVLKNWLHSDNKEAENIYKIFQLWNIPNRWTLVKDGNLFGKYVHSAYYIKGGKGDKKVVWRANIAKPGLYDVYCYSTDYASLMAGRWRRHGRNRHSNLIGDFHYTIHSDAGADEVTVEMGNSIVDWTLLGSYYFSKGAVVIELSNKSKGKAVVADAVKLIKKEKR